MFDAHPPFQIDGNFGGARAIVEMLMQSRDGEILLLPALPRAWPSGSVSGLRARGGLRVDLAWRAGALTSATVTADVSGTTAVRLNGKRIDLNLSRGQSARLRGAELRRA
jgi:alpha-L-fucosidase 2